MTKKIGAYDYEALHVLPEGSGVFSLFERRLKLLVLNPAGRTIEVLPDGTGLSYKMEVLRRGDRIVLGWALVPVKEREEV